jgi:hypothetical protein
MDIEKWNIDNLVDSCSAKPLGSKKMIIPSIQRRRVWTNEQENELIETLKLNKISIGTLQVYKMDPIKKKEIYLLADGLNRCTTLVNYFNDPLSFTLAKKYIKEMEDDMIEKYKKSHKDSNLENLCSTWFCKENLGGYKDLVMERTFNEKTEELKAMVENVIDKGGRDAIYKFLLTKTKDLCKELDISKSVIGVVVNTDITTLPTLYKRINQNGTPLSACEVLAAQWCEKEVNIENYQIVECIKDHYNDMKKENNGMEIFSITDGKYTAYDYINGLTRHLGEKYENTFFSYVKDNEFIFKILANYFVGDISKKAIRQVGISILEKNLTILEDEIYWAFDFVSDALDKLIIVGHVTKNGVVLKSIVKEVPFFVGLISYLIINKKKIEKKIDYFKKLLQLNLLNDTLADVSFNAKIIKSLVEDKIYMNKVSTEEFSGKLKAYSERTIKTYKNKLDIPTQLLLMYLKNILANENANDMEFGTVISKKAINDFNKDEKEFLSVGALGNMCLYDYGGVSKKASDTVIKYLTDQNMNDEDIYNNYLYLNDNIDYDNIVARQQISKNNYLKFLRYRVSCMKKIILTEYSKCFESDSTLEEDNVDEDNVDEDNVDEDNVDEDNVDEDNVDEDNVDEDNVDEEEQREIVENIVQKSKAKAKVKPLEKVPTKTIIHIKKQKGKFLTK